MERDGYIFLPNTDAHRCFGCSPSNPVGLKMAFYTREEYVYSWLSVPEHLCGWDNLVHGGIITTMLDEAASRAAIYFCNKMAVTKTINLCFLKPVLIGQELMIKSRIVKKSGKRQVSAIAELWVNDQCCSTAEGTFSVFPALQARKLNLADEAALNWLENQPVVDDQYRIDA